MLMSCPPFLVALAQECQDRLALEPGRTFRRRGNSGLTHGGKLMKRGRGCNLVSRIAGRKPVMGMELPYAAADGFHRPFLIRELAGLEFGIDQVAVNR